MDSATTQKQHDEKRRKLDGASIAANVAMCVSYTTTSTSSSSVFDMSDGAFCEWIASQLTSHPLSKDFGDIFDKAPRCITRWRERFRDNPALWRRLFDKDRVVKEFIEAVPVLDAVVQLIAKADAVSETKQKYNIIDLCSGKGYLSMLLSELLPPEKVFRIVLIDKAFPMRNQQPQSHHVNWEHIYGERPVKMEVGTSNGETLNATTKKTYYDTWPISLDTSKQDLKSSRQLHNLQNHHLSSDHPAIILAIHLCGTLSLRAVQLFNDNPNTVVFLALKPCCLPGMVHVKHEIFHIGNHQFDAATVCIHGKWKQNKWVGGPPRHHMQHKFEAWANHLYCGIIAENDCDSSNGNHDYANTDEEEGDDKTQDMDISKTRKLHCRIMVQQDGGFQNDFLFAQRPPITDSIWEQLQPFQVLTDQRSHHKSD